MTATDTGEVPEDVAAVVERMRIGAYPIAILRRHANALSATLPRELFSTFDFSNWQGWQAKQPGEVALQTMAPSVVSQRVREWAKEFKMLETKLPAYLPVGKRDGEIPGPRITTVEKKR